MTFRRIPALALVLTPVTLLYLGVFVWMGRYDAFWSEDAGIKYLQALQLMESRGTDAAIAYPGQSLDPHFQFHPLAGTHTRIRDGKMNSVYPLLFPLASALMLRWLGPPGLYVMPLLSSVALILLSYLLARQRWSETQAALIALCTACASPLLFYAFTFWEINTAALLLLAGVYVSVRRSPHAAGDNLAAGMLMGSVLFFRTELILFPAAYALARGSVRRRWAPCLWLGAGSAVMASVFLVFQQFTEGTLLTQYAHNLAALPETVTGVGGRLAHQLGVLRELLLAGHWNPRIDRLLLAPVAATGLWLTLHSHAAAPSPDPPSRWTGLARHARAATRLAGSRAAYGVTLLLGVLLLSGFVYHLSTSFTQPLPIRTTPVTSGLLVFSPWVILSFYRPPGSDAASAEGFRATLLTALAIGLIAPVSGGLQWGPRFLVPLYPLLILLVWESAAALRLQSTGRIGLTLLLCGFVLVSTVQQARGLHLLRAKKGFNQVLMQTIAASPVPTVVAQPWWIPLNVAAVYHQKELFAAPGPEPLGHLLTRLRQDGREAFLFISAQDDRIIRGIETHYGLRPQRLVPLHSPVDRFFSVYIAAYRLPGRADPTGTGRRLEPR